jgi:hypothetical protein
MKLTISAGIAAVMLLVLAGCAKPPTEQIDAAEKSVADAQQSGASAYTPQDYAKLEGLLANVKKEVADQDAKFALLRDYGKAEQLAASAKAEAERVKGEVIKKKEEAKAAALQAQQVAQEAVKATQALVAKAPVGKDRAALEAIKADVDGLTKSLSEVQTLIDGGDYLAAQNKAKAIHEKSQAVSAEIQNAMGKISAAKGKQPQPKKGK